MEKMICPECAMVKGKSKHQHKHRIPPIIKKMAQAETPMANRDKAATDLAFLCANLRVSLEDANDLMEELHENMDQPLGIQAEGEWYEIKQCRDKIRRFYRVDYHLEEETRGAPRKYLPPVSRILELHRLGKSNREIAKRIGVSEFTIRQRLKEGVR